MADEEVTGDTVGDLSAGPAEDVDSLVAGVASADRRRGSGPLGIAAIAGLILALVLGGLCGWLGYQVRQVRQADQQRELFVNTAKQGAVNLTTIDYTHAESDVKRILDMATGSFRDDFSNRSGPFVEVVKKVRSKSSGNVTEAGLESVSGDEGLVLVAVTVTSTSPDGANPPPRYWRMRLTIRSVYGDAKIAKVDFVT